MSDDIHERIDEFHERLFALTPAARGTTALLAVNIAIYVAMVIRGENGFWGDARSLVSWGANFGPATRSEWWRLLAAPFLHGGVLHLALNMVALESGGPLLERSLGTGRFLAVYVLTAVAASIGSVVVHPQLVSVGASGAVFGIFGALLGIALHHAPPADRWSYLRPSFGRPEPLERSEDSPPPTTAGFMPPALSRLLATQIVGLVILNGLIGLAVPVIDNAAHAIGFLGGLGLGWLVAGAVSVRLASVPPTLPPAERTLPDRSRWVVPTAAVLCAALVSNAVFPLLPIRARLAILDTGCGIGAGGACLAASREIRDATGGRDSPAARTYMERGCRAGSGASCTALGIAMFASTAGAAAAARPFATGCELGDAGGCRAWGWLLETGQGVARDLPGAMRAYERACNGREAFGCLRLAAATQDGRGVARDPRRSAVLAVQACDLGEPRGCTLRGAQLDAANDPRGAIAQFERACSAGEPVACLQLGERYEVGRGATRDLKRAASYHATACARGQPVACTRAGRVLERTAEAKDLTKAADMYEAGCRLGQAPSCFNVGVMYAEGRGRPRDAAKALTFYEQACARGLKQVCALVAQLRESAAPPR